MDAYDQILAQPCGARFYRADLHIHSFGASYDVMQPSMVPSEIAREAKALGLDIISLTDHNEISNVEEAIRHGEKHGILVIPGVELSTPEGHLLVYFERVSDLSKFCSRIDLVDRGTEQSRCRTSALQCLQVAADLDGFGILAHVDAPSGFEERCPGGTPHKADILCHGALLGLEVRSASSPISYSPLDPDPQRASAGKQRAELLDLSPQQNLARTLFSDSHTLEALGRNADRRRRLTRLKMDDPSFHGLKLALQDADARVRLEDEIPSALAHVEGVQLSGGFLDGTTIHFSRNLNCIIGGRGTGKSTLLEVVRSFSENPSTSDLVDSEVWPTRINLLWRDEAAQLVRLERLSGQDIENLDDAEFGPDTFEIDSYGQGETAEISQKAKSDPGVLLSYLDRFVDLEPHRSSIKRLLRELFENQTKIEEAELQVAQIPQYQKLLATRIQQLKVLQRERAEDLIMLERKIAEERSIQKTIDNTLDDIWDIIETPSLPTKVEELRSAGALEGVMVGAANFKRILEAIDRFEKDAKDARDDLSRCLQALVTAVEAELNAWQEQEKIHLHEVEKKREELLAAGIRLDFASIRRLAEDEATYSRTLQTLEKWRVHLGQVRRRRKELLDALWGERARVFDRRNAFARRASGVLREWLQDLQVSVKITEGTYSPEAEAIIQRAMQWRTINAPRARHLVRNLGVRTLVEALSRTARDHRAPLDAISAIQLENGEGAFSRADATEIITRLSAAEYRFPLEACVVDDLPRLQVTRRYRKPDGSIGAITRHFTQLSLGQQQSVLLTILLSADDTTPLLIDQPEDNLDSEFIYRSLVPVLRRAKERRQIIVVTHNPNIAVLGDAEQIIVLRSHGDHGSVLARGSIDAQKTREHACKVLEGSRQAFRRRAKVYGVL